MTDGIVELPEDERLRKEVVNTMNDVCSYAATLRDNPTEDMEECTKDADEDSIWDEAWWRAEIFGKAEKIKDAFDKYVIDKMPKPQRVCRGEIVEAFFDLTKPSKPPSSDPSAEDINVAYSCFLNYVGNHVLSYRSSYPFPICITRDDEAEEALVRGVATGYAAAIAHRAGAGPQVPSEDGGDRDATRVLWSKNGVSVRLVGRSHVETSRVERYVDLDATVEGCMSRSACEQLRFEIGPVLRTTIWSISLLEVDQIGVMPGGVNKVPIRGTGPSGESTYLLQPLSELPFIGEQSLVGKKWLIERCLDAYYLDPARKDSIDRRVRNAVHLLVEADCQSNSAVGLALSVAAIEALIGENAENLGEKLAYSAAALLEPDRSRRNAAIRFVKDLYNTRSKTLHGEKVEAEDRDRPNARHLAAGVLSAMISRRDFLARLGYDPETPRDLLRDLQDKLVNADQPMGVDESNVRQLWKHS